MIAVLWRDKFGAFELGALRHVVWGLVLVAPKWRIELQWNVELVCERRQSRGKQT